MEPRITDGMRASFERGISLGGKAFSPSGKELKTWEEMKHCLLTLGDDEMITLQEPQN